SDADILNLGDFLGRALFDWDVVSIGDGQIERGNGCGDVERHAVFLGENGDLISADFIRGVAVGGDAVGTGHDRSNLPGFEEVADHVVGDEREGNAAFVELPSGEARALQVRARFGHEHVEVAALLDGDADDPESGADATGGEGARVALGHDLAV